MSCTLVPRLSDLLCLLGLLLWHSGRIVTCLDKASLASASQWIFIESGFVNQGLCFRKSGQFRLLSIVVGVPIWETGYLGLIGLHDDVLAGPH